MNHSAPTRPPLERGVYRSPFMSRTGYRVLVAVDRCGRFVADTEMDPGEIESDAIDRLKEILNRLDPNTFTIKARGSKHAITKLIQRSQRDDQ